VIGRWKNAKRNDGKQWSRDFGFNFYFIFHCSVGRVLMIASTSEENIPKFAQGSNLEVLTVTNSFRLLFRSLMSFVSWPWWMTLIISLTYYWPAGEAQQQEHQCLQYIFFKFFVQ
jgi:hypothetical protein